MLTRTPQNRSRAAHARRSRRTRHARCAAERRRADVRSHRIDIPNSRIARESHRAANRKKLDLMRVPGTFDRIDRLYFYLILLFIINQGGRACDAKRARPRAFRRRQRHLNGGGGGQKFFCAHRSKRVVFGSICANLREVYFSPTPSRQEKKERTDRANGPPRRVDVARSRGNFLREFPRATECVSPGRA